jgi:hypothetical protein
VRWHAGFVCLILVFDRIVMALPIQLSWHPLEAFSHRFAENLTALRTHDPNLSTRLEALTPATPYFIAAHGDNIFLGQPTDTGIQVVPDPLPASEARRLLASLYPTGNIGWSLLIGGLAYGWAWDRIARLPCKVDGAPGHTPPIYLLTADVDRLWAVLHVMDWRELLASPRMQIFAGADAGQQFVDQLSQDTLWPIPRASLRIESNLWPGDLNSMIQLVAERRQHKLTTTRTRLATMYPTTPGADWSQRLQREKLRIVGVTSRFTTFLQHAMRDWLAGFEQMGHETHLVIDPADHLLCNAQTVTEQIAELAPDLIVIIDHYRAEMQWLPEEVPCVMWVQDRLPNIYCPKGGASQGPRDFCLGFGRLHLNIRYGYPLERFLSTPVGINERRFANIELSAADRDRFGCDVSYVSHASQTGEQLAQQFARTSSSPEISRLATDLLYRIKAWYAIGGQALCEVQLREMLQRSMIDTRVELDEKNANETIHYFHHNVNNAIFRHQSLQWLADAGVNLHLWGRGWETHPTLNRFARGLADNTHDLPRIYRASKINLQVTPHGSVHQRLLDGLAVGGFFLLRWHPGDAVGLLYRDLMSWCETNGIQSEAQLRQQADVRINAMIDTINALEGTTDQNRVLDVFDVMQGHADSDFMTSADSIWNEYPQVAFNTPAELSERLTRFLSDDAGRQQIADSMRSKVIERVSYTAINRRLLSLIHTELSKEQTRCAA